MPRSAVNLFNDILLTAQNLLLYVRKALGFDEESGYKKEQAIADLSRKADHISFMSQRQNVYISVKWHVHKTIDFWTAQEINA